ncbi:MAG TPA: hypothetical protein VNO23_07525 [Candidatus Binatia bacterium]|nr:hypothetical protein [Candidatus Binatia bacterium]
MRDLGLVRVVIGIPGADGSIYTRHWTVSRQTAEDIARQLGTPETELIAPPEAAAGVIRAVRAVPGVLRTDRER